MRVILLLRNKNCKKCLYQFSMLCNKLPQIQWLKTTPIYYFTVSVSQKSRHDLTGSSAHVVTKLQSRCQPGPVLSEAWAQGPLLNSHSFWQDLFPHSCKICGSFRAHRRISYLQDPLLMDSPDEERSTQNNLPFDDYKVSSLGT